MQATKAVSVPCHMKAERRGERFRFSPNRPKRQRRSRGRAAIFAISFQPVQRRFAPILTAAPRRGGRLPRDRGVGGCPTDRVANWLEVGSNSLQRLRFDPSVVGHRGNVDDAASIGRECALVEQSDQVASKRFVRRCVYLSVKAALKGSFEHSRSQASSGSLHRFVRVVAKRLDAAGLGRQNAASCIPIIVDVRVVAESGTTRTRRPLHQRLRRQPGTVARKALSGPNSGENGRGSVRLCCCSSLGRAAISESYEMAPLPQRGAD